MTEKRKEEIRSFAEVWAEDGFYSPGPVWPPMECRRFGCCVSRRHASDMLIECLGEIERLQNFSEKKARRAAQLDAYMAVFEK